MRSMLLWRATPAALLTVALQSVLVVAPGVPAARASVPTVHGSRRACAAPAGVRLAACHALLATDAEGHAISSATPLGYAPAELQAAYALPSPAAQGVDFVGVGQTVAVVDAYDDPSAETDLAVYRATYGLPPCTTASGCFRKVNQRGGTTSPAADQGWAVEISLDLDMVSAICPACHILLVETDTNSFDNLAAGVDTAVALGATAVSNSYGAPEFSGETSYEAHYNHPRVPITVSSGDSGYGVEYPAASQYVVAVGGTSLNVAATTRGYTETAWSGAGSGCSAYVAKPAWQTDSGCARRTVADVSAVADPATGVSVYDSYGYGALGFLVVGGTSASAPIIASVYALNGQPSFATPPKSPYSNRDALYDVTSGSNGACAGSYLCTAGSGYDGPTGLGTPHGVAAFGGPYAIGDL
jgi:subtilase family serine protease